MILVDTSIWVDHLHKGDPLLDSLLTRDLVLMHPHVFGEIMMGRLRDRAMVIHSLQRLPEMRPARDWEVLDFVERHSLHGSGLGYIDAHLLVGVRLMPEAQLWTRDRRLLRVAERLGVAVRPHDA